ncbi:alpha/beta fold hydrolase [Ochrobactrum teleogrylli]
MIFVHGFCCDRSDWVEIVKELSDRFCCIVLDLPGHGQTPVGTCTTMQALGEAVNSVRAIDADTNAILIGHSLGAKVIREAYRQNPEGIAGMILIDGSLYVSDRTTMIANAKAALASGVKSFLTGLFGRMFFLPPPADWFGRILQRALSRDPEFVQRIFLDSIEWDLRYAVETIKMINVPSLVIQSTTFDHQFRWRPLEYGESTGLIDTMRQFLTDFHVEHIQDAGHFVMQDAPSKTAAAISGFATKLNLVSNDTTDKGNAT